ncbi:MAG TPA: DUF4114 domain-containing protein [Pirellulales bacterium]|jgi:hypothetical protein|nr:DUF4114 domain-containing protein [Pirellulales bacterium]
MNKRILASFLVLGVLSLLATTGEAQTVSSYQSSYRPSGLPLVGKTYLAGTDTASAAEVSLQSAYISMIKKYLPEGQAFTGIGLNQLDPKRLYFLFSYAPRVYFIYEGACYTDALGATIATVSSPTNKPTTGTSYTLFPDQKSWQGSACATGSARSSTEPLQAGDFVKLPTVNAGQQLAFFIMSNLNTSGTTPQYTFYNGASNNPDNFQHMIAFFPSNNSQYIIIGFEDEYGGGDMDCNDLMFVVDVGVNNAAAWSAATNQPQ